MAGVYSFRGGPAYRGIGQGEMVTAALEQPLGFGANFVEQAVGGALSSPGLGTVIRDVFTPEGTGEGPTSILDMGLFPSPLKSAVQYFINDETSPALSQEAYKTSPYYRAEVPWDAGMTEDRAASLASWYDARKVREHFAEKRPISSFIGGMAGQAFDPINYIPVAGPAVKAAAVARVGRVGGAAIAGSLDAAANTAIAGLATASTRARFGDDVSWQAQVTDIAVGAFLGAAFGTLGGALEGRAAGRSAVQIAKAETQLATLKTTQQARIALNEAIGAIARGDDITLSPNVIEPVQRAAEAEAPRFAIERMAREADPAAFARLETLEQTFSINQAEIQRLQSAVMDDARFGETRRAMTEIDQIGERLRKTEEKLARATGEKQVAKLTRQRDEIRTELQSRLNGIDDALVQEIEDLDQALTTRRSVQEPVVTERAQLQQRTRERFDLARDQFWATRTAEARNRPSQAPDAPRLAPPVDASPPRAESAPVGRPEAEASVAKREDAKAAAMTYRINSETGAFDEEIEIAQVRTEGRLTEEDEAELAAADEAFQNGDAYGKALDAAVACLI